MTTSAYYSNRADFIRDPAVRGYDVAVPFDPPELYPELPFLRATDAGNRIYPMIREFFRKLGLDAAGWGTPAWNPLGEIVRPGMKVLIKPNLVTHQHPAGDEAVLSAVVHGSVLRPVIDYVRRALDGRGSILIADNPMESSDFGRIMERTGIGPMAEEIMRRDGTAVEVLDLRPRVLREAKSGRFFHEERGGDPRGYLPVDLAGDSHFGALDGRPNVHYYTLADPTIDHLDPKSIRESATDAYHRAGSHRYLVSRTVLESDAVIGVAKMKTHCKAGVSLSLKNMIGIVAAKECLPHHRAGAPPDGDSFPFLPAAHYVASRKAYRMLRRVRIHRLPGFQSLRGLLQRERILLGRQIEHGNWKGNDTVWRTTLDLNRILLFADSDGRMRDSIQRRSFNLIDGIVAMQGDGPTGGDPLAASIVLGGFNPAATDALAAKAMGIDYRLIKAIAKASSTEKWPVGPGPEVDLAFPGLDVPDLSFRLPRGWED
jgi:uncharacterized protein (DUF362 family)